MLISKKTLVRLAISVAALISAILLFDAHPLRIHGEEGELEKILTACARYCDRLKEARLNFTCLEEIEEKIFHPYLTIKIDSFRTYKRERHEYCYDYQLIKDAGTVMERRILIRENGKDKRDEDAGLKTKRFDYQFVINGPIGVLDKEWQKHFDYQIAGKEEINHKTAFILDAVPKSTFPMDHLFGRIWVHATDFGIMKIEWSQKSLGQYEAIKKTAEELNAVPDIKLCSEYYYEKNGIRFPSKYSVAEDYKAGPRVLTKSKLTVTYKDYKYFTVETSVKYDRRKP